ncbi:MAG: tetratricopeptide repeat protein, partial [Caldilineae bacterium]
RSYLGLTQVLAMQGRYQEAETAIQRAIVGLPVGSVLQAQARMNLANLLVRQDRHAEALDQYAMVRDIYLQHLEQTSGEEQRSLQGKLARLAVNQANALMYLDRPIEAERMLQEALSRFQEAQDALNLGRTYTNLGVLHLRTGRYGDALDALQRAGEILVEDVTRPEAQMERLRQADILLLEQANAFLALNLIPEAIAELERAIHLFQSANQPRELGQALYTLGMVQLHNNDLTLAHETLERAQQVFQQLEAPSWLNRVRLAQATLAYRAGDSGTAQEMVDALLAEARSLRNVATEKEQEARPEEIGPGWDLALLVEVWLLQLRLHLEGGDLEAATQAGRCVAHLLAPSDPGQEDAITLMPHFRLQMEHATGILSLMQGDAPQAIQHFQQAIHLLERQRIRLPLEEFKTAYLEDKGEIYSDLVFGFLQAEEKDLHASIFAVTEQARARALLERIYAVGNEREAHPDR